MELRQIHAPVQAQETGAGEAGVTEGRKLLSEQNNGQTPPRVAAAEAKAPIETSCSGRVRREMNAVVFSRVRLWMVIALLLVAVAAVVSISVLVVCSVMDEDEEFDPASFTVPQYFTGSFKLPNVDLSRPPLSNTTAQIEGMLGNLFGSSPALGRYFTEARINSSGDGSVTASYRLSFLMPEGDRGQLLNFTLSRETVFNVLRQFLYDRESEPLYIDPASLSMS